MIIVAATVTAVVLGAGIAGFRYMSPKPCDRRTALTVAVPPEMLQPVRDTAAAWSAREGVCATVSVTGGEPSDVAAAVAAQHRVTMTGLGEAKGTTTIPEVWIPDSSVWLVRLAALAPGFRPAVEGSVARSPIVLAMPEPTAANLGWTSKAVTWSNVLDALVAKPAVKSGMVEPTQDAAGLSGLLSLSRAAAQRPDAQNLITAALRAVASGGSSLRADLLAKFPQSNSPVDIATSLNAAALSEADVLRYNAGRPAVPLAAVNVQPAPAELNYPFTLMPGIDPAKAIAVEGFRAALAAAAFHTALAPTGLRPPTTSPDPSLRSTGTASPRPDTGTTTDAGQPNTGAGAGNLDLAAVDRLLATWTVVTGPARMLAVIDVSGSMLKAVPTAGNATRIDLTVQTARQGLALLDDTWSLGLWVFGSQLDGDRAYKQLVPIGRLSNRRPELAAALDGVRATNGTATAFNDTLYNAYRAVQKDWKAGEANSVVIFTDGIENNDPTGGLSEAELAEQLKRIADPKRPVQIVLIGIGDQVKQRDLERIATTTGSGSAFVAEDPAKIGEIFLKAVARRPVQPR